MKILPLFLAYLGRVGFFNTASLLLLSLTFLAPCAARAQLVADGETYILDGVATNVVGNLVVGTNSSFTLLVLTNSATLTNTGDAAIGNNATAYSNSVMVAGAGATWQCVRGLTVGALGSCNELLVSGGTMTNEFCFLGNDVNSSNNSVTVTGAGSLFGSHQGIVVGRGGFFHQFTVSNGGRVSVGNSDSDISGQSIITVTGAGSQWKGEGMNNMLNVGGFGPSLSNRLVVADGGRMENVTCWIGIYGSKGDSVLITDSTTLFTNLSASMGGSFNQLTISNGAVMAGLGTAVNGSSNVMVVGGLGSLCANSQEFGISGTSVQVWVVNNGTLTSRSSYIGGTPLLAPTVRPTNNTFIVTDSGSLWQNQSNLWIGLRGGFNQMVVSNGGMVVTENGYLGGNYGFSRSNAAIITGSGSTWINRRELQVGNVDAYQQVFLTNGGTLSTSNLILGFSANSVSNRVQLHDGNLMVTNSAFTGTTDVRRGTVVLNSGLFQTDFLKANNGVSSQIQFNGGLLRTRGTAVNNAASFVVGDGRNRATFELLDSGIHSFADGLTVSSNAVLMGNGTIAGDVSIADGGSLSPGSSIGQIAINGSLMLSNGSSAFIELNAQAQTNDNFVGLTSVAYAGTLVLTNLAGTLSNGSVFRLFAAGAYSGKFEGLSPSAPGVGLKWNLNQLPVDGTLRVLSIPTSPPLIANAAFIGSGLVIAAAAGVPYDPVYLLSSTNLTLPASQWEVWATNYFDPVGNTSFTNAPASDNPERYFRLLVE